MLVNEYVLWQIGRERLADARRMAAVEALRQSVRPSPGPVLPRLRRNLAVTNLGRLALVSFLVMLIGVGAVGLWAAALEPRYRRAARAEILDGLTGADEQAGDPNERTEHPSGPRRLR